jgi:hypothetical protein
VGILHIRVFKRDNTWQLIRSEETTLQAVDPNHTTQKQICTSPKSFGLINFADFDPDNCLKKRIR